MAGAMKTLLCSSNIPAVATATAIPPISSNNPRFLTSLPILLGHPPMPTAAARLRANAKGFAGPSHAPTAKLGGRRGSGGGAQEEEEEEEEEEEKIPQVVFERMMVRIVGFVGVPMAAGIGLLHVLGIVKDRQLWEVPLWVPFLTTLLCFGASALGIAYGTLSSSWDPDKAGSVLGFEEAQRNWAEMWRDEADN